MGYIETVHKENARRVALHNIKEGMQLIHKNTGTICQITFVHPLYFWVLACPELLKQDMSNINEFEVIQ